VFESGGIRPQQSEISACRGKKRSGKREATASATAAMMSAKISAG
jgi:hypothetical protein